MKRLLTALAMGLCLVWFAGNVFAAPGKQAEAKGLVKKAVAFYKANGKDKAFAEISSKSGQFYKGELYIFVLDGNGHMLAHGDNPKMIGKNMLELKDSDGKYFIKEFVKIAKRGGGWTDYKWTNPETKRIGEKHTYIESSGDLIFGCGTYK